MSGRVSTWNLANALTALRVLLVPLFGFLLLHDDGTRASYRYAAGAVFAAAMFTDRIDGQIARSRGLVTPFGQVADPIADKAITTMAFVGLSTIGLIPWWISIVVIVREWGITLMRFLVIRHAVMPAGRGGKIKTGLQTAALGMFILPLSTWPLSPLWLAIAWVVLVVAVLVTVVTGIDYVNQAVTLRRTSERTARKGQRG